MGDLTTLVSIIIGVTIGVVLIIGYFAKDAYFKKKRIAIWTDTINQRNFSDEEKKWLIDYATYVIKHPNACKEIIVDTEVKTKDE